MTDEEINRHSLCRESDRAYMRQLEAKDEKIRSLQAQLDAAGKVVEAARLLGNEPCSDGPWCRPHDNARPCPVGQAQTALLAYDAALLAHSQLRGEA